MKNQYQQMLLTNDSVGQLNFDILDSLISLDVTPDNNRIEVALAKFQKPSVKWVADKATDALRVLVNAYPEARTPVYFKGTLQDLNRMTDVVHSQKDWVNELWEAYRYDELFSLTMVMLMSLRHFGEGESA